MTSRGVKSLGAAAVVAALSLTLTACGGSDDGGSAAPELKEGEVAEFTWLHRIPDKEGAKTVNELVDEFNAENPDIKVIPETMQGSATESYAKINSIVEAGKDVPCVTQIGNERVPDMIGSMLDVSEYADQYKDDFIPAFFDKGRVGDNFYGFPQGASPILFYYRQDLFEEYGLSVPTTWDEYKQLAQAVRDKSDNNSYIGAFLTDEPMWLSALTSSEGGNWFGFDAADQAWSVTIDSPESQKVADYWQDLVDNDLV
ncbi:MAG: extracellular solute-binding protein, partial [Actinomycetaceae bacterium]|nr:extracellular solute-binding protein [Actinomycetaceae bacterium]